MRLSLQEQQMLQVFRQLNYTEQQELLQQAQKGGSPAQEEII